MGKSKVRGNNQIYLIEQVGNHETENLTKVIETSGGSTLRVTKLDKGLCKKCWGHSSGSNCKERKGVCFYCSGEHLAKVCTNYGKFWKNGREGVDWEKLGMGKFRVGETQVPGIYLTQN